MFERWQKDLRETGRKIGAGLEKRSARDWQKERGNKMAKRGKNVARAWQEHGNNVARTWQEHSKNMARAGPLLSRQRL